MLTVCQLLLLIPSAILIDLLRNGYPDRLISAWMKLTLGTNIKLRFLKISAVEVLRFLRRL